MPSFTLDRCKALADGVMAITMTLLVVGIDVPADRSSEPGIVAFLLTIGHSVTVYVACFGLLGTYWVLHGAILNWFRRGDRAFIWLNILVLLPVTFIPFAAKLKDAYRESGLAILLLGGLNILIGGCFAALWLYGASHPELLRRPIDGAVRRSLLRRITISPVLVSLAAIVVSRTHVYLGTLVFLTVPLYHLSHRRIDASAPAGEEAGAPE